MKKICVFIKTTKPGVRQTAKEIEKYFKERNYQVFNKINSSVLKKGLDWIMVLGGDGSILHTANKVAIQKVPLVGVNFGCKGYLCRISKEQLLKKMEELHQGNFSVDSYTRIKARITRKNKIIKEIDALNDIVVGGINRVVWLKLKIIHGNQRKLANVVGDGIIFSTQIGSTAYNLYAGGPVLFNDSFSVVACNAFFESDYFSPNTRAFVAPTSASFEVITLRSGQHLPYVVADGQRDYRLNEGDKVVISKSLMTTKLIKFKD
ncbi:MAG: NAD(+)/NADH kinase [Patescibacteria group bacterium]|nr:NAD(+)/NADH kinase [Patescibacteria group bacterium]MDD5164878.1 NAD(+)/NADH kinase [Patescibacteria group bacterium]MDD5534664.1 NAD(+)/NADH kinase [Patescibacteria group bacterium]